MYFIQNVSSRCVYTNCDIAGSDDQTCNWSGHWRSVKRCPKLSLIWLDPKIAVVAGLFGRLSGLFDFATDLILLRKASNPNNGTHLLTVTLVLAVMFPYFLQVLLRVACVLFVKRNPYVSVTSIFSTAAV